MPAERATLYSLPVSHPALAVRGMLDLKGVEYRVVDLIPGMQPVLMPALRFRGGTVPGLVIDGHRIQHSLRISRALDVLRPDPPLFPRDPQARRAVQDAERWGEQVLQDVPRRLFRWSAANSYEVRRWLAVDVSGVPGGSLIARPSLQAKLFARASRADEAAVRADLADMPGHLAEVERLLDAGIIGGPDRNAADFQIAASLRSLAKLGDLAPYLEGQPAVEWAATVLPALPGPVPRTLPAEWLRALPAADARHARAAA
jgi:glutathione S-transferase